MATLTVHYHIRPQDVDFAQQQTFFALGNCLLDAASQSASSFGFGIEEFTQRRLSWVISRLHVETTRYASVNDDIAIETWPRDCNRLASARHFRIYDKAGLLIGEATSLWSVLDYDTRRPVNLLEQVDMRPFCIEQDVAAAAPKRIDELHTAPIATHTVRYSDLDFNAHTNSMKYIQWMLDTLDLAQFDGQHIAAIDINYVHEARFGEAVSILRADTADGYQFDLKSDAGHSFCKAKLAFAPNQ